MVSKSELLLPVGTIEMALAAIHNGADAIYVGVPGFNARGRTQDFEIEELKEIIETCHLYGVKVNLAFNVVIFENEIEKARQLLIQLFPLNPDAFIVQDIGLVRLIRQMAPNQVIHASTQMTVTNHEAIELLRDLGIKRFVLGRENSLDDIKLIREKGDEELEVFVHGALCVAYSGQCFTSESIGGRSANRGQCAQSCRFEYDLIVDGQKKDLVDRNYLVSPQDLCGVAEIPDLLKLKVNSFKVEGRLKTPEYVASAARSYRQAIDTKLDLPQVVKLKQEMATQYSRGFFSGWLHGVDHQQLVDGHYNAHRGAYAGVVKQINKSSVVVLLESEINFRAGDGVMLATQLNGHKNETGAKIFEVAIKAKDKVELFFSRDFKLTNNYLGSKVYLNRDEQLSKELKKSYQDRQVTKKIPVNVQLHLDFGNKILAKMSDGIFEVVAESDSFLTEGLNRPTTKIDLENEMRALGGTCFTLANFEANELGKAYFISNRELKILRQKLTEQLIFKRVNRTIDSKNISFEFSDILPKTTSLNLNESAKLNVVLREYSQVEDLCGAVKDKKIGLENLDHIILDFEFGKDFKRSVDHLKQHNLKSAIATTRVLKPSEYHNLKLIERCKPEAILVRNLGALHYFTKISPFDGELLGDFSFNVTNHLSAEYLLSKGLHSICVSYDLNEKQVVELIEKSPANQLEITIYQYMPSFHMEHCVFAAFLSNGKSFRDCGKPCEKHQVELKDQFGHQHFIKADQECRNTMFNGVAQSALSFVENWKTLGVKSFRFEALFETGDSLVNKISHVLAVVSGAQYDKYQEKLGLNEKYGLSHGNLNLKNDYKDRKKSY